MHKIVLCFYCNTPSTVKFERPLREWYCHECEQTNRLDENGEITDYIPPALAPPIRPLSVDSPFCDTCISNQTLIIQNLASFLPSEDHPDYDTYLAALPAHKAQLEQKYPQVCLNCEERVRQRLKHNNYLAKTSVLGQLLKKPLRYRRSWRDYLWYVRGTLWWITSVAFFIALYFPLNLAYIAFISPFVVMWDYKWLQAQRSGGRVTGLREYRELQFIVLVVRIIACKYNAPLLRAFYAVISFMCLIYSLGILKIEYPKVALTEEPSQLQARPIPPPQPQFPRDLPRAQAPPVPAVKSTSAFHPSPPSVLPSGFHDPSEMDWTPSVSESIFARGKGLPPAPLPSLPREPIAPVRPSEEIKLREPRLFAPQVPLARSLMQESTGLETLLGQTTLEDEPTLVRAVKSVKRTMAKNEKLKRVYTALTFSAAATSMAILLLFSIKLAVIVALVVLQFRSVAATVVILAFSVLPLFDHPSTLLEYIGGTLVISTLVYDIIMLILIKREESENRRKEQMEREKKLRKIFYT